MVVFQFVKISSSMSTQAMQLLSAMIAINPAGIAVTTQIETTVTSATPMICSLQTPTMTFQSTLTPQLPIPSSVSVQRGQSLMISDSVTLVTKDARYASTNLMLSVTCAQTAPIRCTKVSVQLDVPKTISRTIIIICAHSILKNLIIPLLQRTQWDALTVIFGTGSNKIALHVHMLA